jgi:hypothetical protein
MMPRVFTKWDVNAVGDDGPEEDEIPKRYHLI